MGARTIENCSLIQKHAKAGMSEPHRYWYINMCEGYQRGKDDDELCEQCKKCRFCTRR